ncbi:MAG: glycoside hydrolase family protein [Bacteroides sp.]|nr:glycoside hydrolase family protein [Bacteroides sp.]
MKRTLLYLTLLCLFPLCLPAQITERPRPEEWKRLTLGGRYMDRFLPMKGEKKQSASWGTDSVRIRYVDNGIERDDTSFWGGNILQDADGSYHLFVCGWPENSPKGHMYWPNSTVFHATSEQLHGPYTVQDTLGKGHNPEAFRLADGRIVVYVINGFYVAPDMNGPWQRGTFEFDPRDRKIIEGLSNLTFTRRQDGSFLMVCRGGGIWVSRDGLSPYRQLSDRRVYPDVDGRFEDPVVWRDSLQYHLIVNDWLGRIAFYQRSKDGLHWVTEPGEAYVPGISVHADGHAEQWFKYERAKVFQDEHGRVAQMNFAVIDTIKWEDLPNDRHSSKNICIPMNRGLLLSVLNKKPITPRTRTIKLRIKAEPGFDPQRDIDLSSLRFGSYTEVNYGRGSKPLRAKSEGQDLIVTFSGKESGIGSEEFAPKLLGRTRQGELLYGYARLPYVDYTPPLLSARAPIYNKEENCLQVCVENFGLRSSRTSMLTISCGKQVVARGEVPPLQPYASTEVRLPLSGEWNSETYAVVIGE